MTDFAKVEALHRRLLDERRRSIEAAAEIEALPPAGRLAYLADLDATIIAIEAVLQEQTQLEDTAKVLPWQANSEAAA